MLPIHEDRRRICELHGPTIDTINRIESKLDGMVTAVAYVKAAIDNGLRRDIKETGCEVLLMSKRMDDAMTALDKKYEGVAEFKWFREWMTDFRNNLFKNTLKFSIVGGAFYLFLHFGDTLLKGFLRG